INNNYKGEHNFRSYTSDRILIANSTFIRPKRTKASVIISASDMAGRNTEYALISNLTFDATVVTPSISTTLTVQKVIVEKSKLLLTNDPNSVAGKYQIGSASDMAPARDIIARNNVGIQITNMFIVDNAENVKIYGNTYYENDPLLGGRMVNTGSFSKNITFKDNLAYVASTQEATILPHFFRSGSEYTYTTSDYGYYYAPHHQNDFSAYFNGVNAYMTLPAWQTATGNDMHSKRLTATEANNLFVNPAGADGIINTLDDDLSLKAGSIAIDKGEAMPGLFEDHKGNPRDATPDIGAFEYQ
ncbi:MAG TPA: choice-of-anchor Q domain-containing protein, partial [archaeon]|nr:choice-of-anchor Q domain-containing protein [archaeon]